LSHGEPHHSGFKSQLVALSLWCLMFLVWQFFVGLLLLLKEICSCISCVVKIILDWNYSWVSSVLVADIGTVHWMTPSFFVFSLSTNVAYHSVLLGTDFIISNNVIKMYDLSKESEVTFLSFIL
jgi:hypothetical protein